MLIVFEGIDGAGKTFTAQQLISLLVSKKIGVVYSPFPSNSEYGKLAVGGKSNYEKILLHCLDFKQRWKWMAAEMAAGNWVVCDRYLLSTQAYNTTNQREQELFDTVSQDLPQPDLTIFIDMPVDLAVTRILWRKDKLCDGLNCLTKPDPNPKQLEAISSRYARLLTPDMLIIKGINGVEQNLDIIANRLKI